MARHYRTTIIIATRPGKPKDERMGIMVEKEWLQKKNSLIQRLLRNAFLGLDACMEDIDYTVERTTDKKTVKVLSTCSFIEQKLNIVISGKTGSSKTYIACAIGNAMPEWLLCEILQSSGTATGNPGGKKRKSGPKIHD